MTKPKPRRLALMGNECQKLALSCPECQRETPASPAVLLTAVADALNACRDAGLKLRIRHGIPQCDEGLVLDLPDGTWVTRTRTYTPFGPDLGGDFDD